MGRRHDIPLRGLPILQKILDVRHCFFRKLCNLIQNSSSFFITTIYSSTIGIYSLPQSALWVSSSCSPIKSTSNTESRCSDVTCLMSTCRWERTSWWRKGNLYSGVKQWRNGFGLQLTLKKLSVGATDNPLRMIPQISLILSYYFKTLLEGIQTILQKSHLLLEMLKSEFDNSVSLRSLRD